MAEKMVTMTEAELEHRLNQARAEGRDEQRDQELWYDTAIKDFEGNLDFLFGLIAERLQERFEGGAYPFVRFGKAAEKDES